MVKTERYLGQFELLVLLAIRRLEPEDRYLAKVVTELEDRTSRWVNVGNAHTTLESLKNKGYLRGRTQRYVKSGPGRKTRFVYELTDDGDTDLNLAVRDIIGLMEDVDLWGKRPTTSSKHSAVILFRSGVHSTKRLPTAKEVSTQPCIGWLAYGALA